MNDDVPLAPPDFAALVAPAIDRIFISAMATAHEFGGTELNQRYGGPAATGFLVEFRSRAAAPGGVVSGPGFAAVTRYRDSVECQRVLDKQVAHAMIVRQGDGGFSATDRGRSFLADLYELHARITREIWDGYTARVARLVGMLGLLLTAAAEDADAAAFHAMAPPYEPDGTPSAVLLLNRLGALRYHRADAHAAAWGAAGHTARSIAELTPGPQRQTIELETNRRAGMPYAALTAPERLALLADLAALPG